MTSPQLYNPAAFRVADHALLSAVVEGTVFGTLLSNGPDGPQASHLPFLLNPVPGTPGMLRGHLARANDHWPALAGTPVLVLFQGPAHYVSPGWYASKQQTGRVVPTWNYVVVHARGRAQTYDDPVRLRALVEALTARMEQGRPNPWSVDDAPADYIDALTRQIVGIDIELNALEGKFKLGQNRSAPDRGSLAAGLEQEQPALWRRVRTLLDEQAAADSRGAAD